MERLIRRITIIDLVFFMMLAMLFTVPEHPVLYLVANAFAALFCFLVLLDRRGEFKVPAFSVMYAVFSFLCFLSYFYSINASQSMIRIKSIPVLLMLFCAGINYFSREDNLQKFMVMYVGAALLSCVYLFLTEDIFSGEAVGWGISNTNIVGTRFAFAVVFTVYFLLQQIRWWKILMTAVLVMFLFLTASRSSAVIMTVSVVVLVITTFRQKKKSVIVALLVATALILLFLYLIFHVELLYNVIGVRLEGVFSLVETGEGDSSSEKRLTLMRYGWQSFQEHPLFGQGINTFISETKQALGFKAYSHNNYLELLVGVGLVGTLSYYVMPATLLWNSFQLMGPERKSATLGALVFSLLVGMFVSDFFTVNYYSKTMILMYMFAGSACIKYSGETLLQSELS